MTTGETFEVDFLTHAYGGETMGRLPDGRAVFVPGVLPGERARIRLVEQKRSFARGALVEVLRPSAERVLPLCPAAAACGGCHYQHMHYAAQLNAKAAVLKDQLQRIAGIVSPPVEPMIPSPREWHYRNAVQFHLDPQGRLGFQEQGKHTIIPVETCMLCEPAIEEILPALDFAGATGLERVQVRAGAGDDILLVLESSDPFPPEFSVDLPLSAVFVGPGGFEENFPLVLAGDDGLIMEAAGRAFRVSAGSFFQVNTQQAENMLRYLLERLPLTPGLEVLEVYAGVGLFSAFLAPRVTRLVAVESATSAVDDFAINLDEFDNVELYAGAAEEILPKLETRPYLALVDPPRAGLALPALDALARMAPELIAYVSCDPATLARDAKRLVAAGYCWSPSSPSTCSRRRITSRASACFSANSRKVKKTGQLDKLTAPGRFPTTIWLSGGFLARQALEIGQSFLAAAAYSWNAALSIPGTTASVSSSISVIAGLRPGGQRRWWQCAWEGTRHWSAVRKETSRSNRRSLHRSALQDWCPVRFRSARRKKMPPHTHRCPISYFPRLHAGCLSILQMLSGLA